MPEVKVENIVASTSFAEKLDLDIISLEYLSACSLILSLSSMLFSILLMILFKFFIVYLTFSIVIFFFTLIFY